MLPQGKARIAFNILNLIRNIFDFKIPPTPLFKGGKFLNPPFLKGDFIDRIPSNVDISLNVTPIVLDKKQKDILT